ncbi:MAG: transporter substrate-binding domain-containing protein [Flavobacteriaceae bacterium]|nr:transporter substrate-binding domain-containing protein [Flavobacteriaceae bacterium]
MKITTSSKKKVTLILHALFLFILLFAISCSSDKQKKITKKPPAKLTISINYDLDSIKKSGVLRAITTFSPTGYFLYRGQTMGFEYEMLTRLANRLNVQLEMVLAKNVDSVIPMLNRGEGDIIAMGYTITGNRKEEVSFTNPFLITHQSLIQKKPNNWRKMTADNIKKHLATDIIDLLQDTVSVRKNTSYYMRLSDISNELGDTIYINILPGETTDEELIKLVADGKIKYTVIDNNIASIHKSYFPNIDVSTPISLSQRIAWAVRKNSPDLLVEINKGLSIIKKKPDYNVIYKKYFKNRRQFNKRLVSNYYTETTGKISKYDDIVKKYAIDLGWDWRLVKALVFQESQFDPNNKSWAGAQGLMQLMPATAIEFGVTDTNDPDQNIKAGIKYLKKMYDYWPEIPDSIQRIKFAMASYNSGFGHVKDAQKLAKKYNKDTLNWDNGVDEFILKLSKPKYYNDPVTKYGYVRGSEPHNYIIEIFNRYKNYTDFAKE